jgi:hypothetical protein
MERRIKNIDEFFLTPTEAKTAIIEFLRNKLEKVGIAYEFPELKGTQKRKKKTPIKFRRGTSWSGTDEKFTSVSHIDSGVLVQVQSISYNKIDVGEIEPEDDEDFDDDEDDDI